MQAFVLDPADHDARTQAVGAVICEEVSSGRQRVFHKGHTITLQDMELLSTIDRTIHLVRLESTELHEDEAGLRLAALLSGPGIEIGKPKQSRVNLIATHKGLLRIDGDRLTAVNRLPGIAAFSLVDRIAVLPGKILAGTKTIPVAIDQLILEEIEAIAGDVPIIQVKPFRPLKVGVISTEVLAGAVLERFQTTVRKKIGWYGGSVLGFSQLPDEAGAVVAGIRSFQENGADLILTGGGNAIDPLDAALNALPLAGADLVKLGAPVHPGSMFWLAYLGDLPIFNLASCSMYSKATSADLILPWIMAGERLTIDDLAGLGFGGLLEGKSMSFRFPPYDAEQAIGEVE